MKTLLCILGLLLLPGISHAGGQKAIIMYYQVSCDGYYTHSYWYSGRILKVPDGINQGLIVAEQEPGKYLAQDAPRAALPQVENVPKGWYQVIIGGYSLPAWGGMDTIYIQTARMEVLP